MTKKGLESILRYLRAHYPLQTITQSLVDGWMLALWELPDELGQKAAVAYSRTPAKYFPRAGELIDLALKIANPNPDESAAEAWGKLLDSHGNEDFLKPDMVAIKVMRMLGGWEVIGQADQWAQLPHIRKDFMTYYKEIRGRELERIALGKSEERPQLGLNSNEKLLLNKLQKVIEDKRDVAKS